jgi:hypothetical protein
MPKKRVGVSLRKPSPAPESVPPSAEVPITPSADPVAAHGNAAVARELEPETVLRADAPLPPEPIAVEAFVNGAAAALGKVATEVPAARLQNLLQRGPEGYRELTLYLPEKLAQDLSLHCLEHNIDMNRLVASAVEQLLRGAAGEPDAQRTSSAPPRSESMSFAPVSSLPANDGVLSVVARALLVELGEWVRAVWAARRRPSRAGTSASAS